jgi:hypothetical protein
VTKVADHLEVWVARKFHGTVPSRLSFFKARAVLKPLGNTAEFRDPVNHETYRYDPATDSVKRA